VLKPAAKRPSIKSFVFSALVVLASIIYGCAKDDMPKATEGSTGDGPSKGLLVVDALESEPSSAHEGFVYGEDTVSLSSPDGVHDFNTDITDSTLEAESSVEPIMPDTSNSYERYSHENNSTMAGRPDLISSSKLEANERNKAVALDDRTQGNVVRLVVDSITLNDCVMRGEIRNYSDDQYARNVTVTVAALDGEESAQWHWPLTMKPGESAPFEVAVDWFPHTYDSNKPIGDIQSDYFLDINNYWDQFGDTSIDIEADLSSMPDLRRAFDFNVDDTEFDVLYQNPAHKFLVYDEKALELEESKNWFRYGREYTIIDKPRFTFVFPGDVVKSHDVDPMVSTFELYKYADIFYVPSRIYPEIYEEGVDDMVSNVRVYQAYNDGSKVIDVRELIPHSVFEKGDDDGLLIDRQLNPISDFINYDISNGESVYVQLLDPLFFPADLDFPVRNMGGEASMHQANFTTTSSKLWIGGVSHSEVSSTQDPLQAVNSSSTDSCYATGALSVGDFYLQGNIGIQRIDILGNLGEFISSESNTDEEIYVERETITLQDQIIRGLIRNNSEINFARDVIVVALHGDTGIQLGTWLWPLSVQPGESAPFEISYSESELTIGHIDFQVSATLSEQVDPTRSFLIARYTGGTVYGKNFENLYEYRAFDSPYPMNYELRLGQVFNHNALTARPGIRYTKGEFLKLYSGVISSENLDSFELFRFRDMYARLEPPDSHPELAKVAATQYIHDLRSYTAILDQDSKVVDVKEIPIFTPIYGQANTSKLYAEVDTIPAPNRWSPNAVRLLQIIPYEDEADMNEGYYSQIWIGGASEPME